ncbi:hypothetical protein Tco_0375888 [Tanacetum coccineum]
MSSLQNIDKELSFTNQFFVEKPQEEEPEKTNAESEVQSMVTVPIHQDTSSVPLRLNKHGSRLYNLENLNIPQKVNKVVNEIVTDAVDWALQALLHLAEARKKRQKKLDSPRTPLGSPPPPPPPSSGASSAPGASRASGSSQIPLPPPPSSSKSADSNNSKQQKNDSGASDSTQLPVATH